MLPGGLRVLNEPASATAETNARPLSHFMLTNFSKVVIEVMLSNLRHHVMQKRLVNELIHFKDAPSLGRGDCGSPHPFACLGNLVGTITPCRINSSEVPRLSRILLSMQEWYLRLEVITEHGIEAMATTSYNSSQSIGVLFGSEVSGRQLAVEFHNQFSRRTQEISYVRKRER